MIALHRLPLRARRVLWHWLLLALVLAPALGQMHRVLHGDGHASMQVVGAQNASLPSAHAWAALFSGHHASDCQLLDALGMADGPDSAALALAHPLPFVPPLVSTPAPVGAQRVARFQARAPPVWRA